MAAPCDQTTNIESIKEEQANSRIVQAQLLRNQEIQAERQDALVKKLDEFFNRLEKILITDVERRKDIESVTKDTDILYKEYRELSHRMDIGEQFRSNYVNNKTGEKVSDLWNWFNQEKGWRRTIPYVMAAISTLSALFTFLYKVA